MEGYIGEIRMFAATFAPRNWQYCAGQILSIAQNTALFSILGTTYGGNGQTTFGLPDFRSRTALGTGQGAALPNCSMGELTGTETVTLVTSNLPQHNHTVTGTIGVTLAIGCNSTAGSASENFPDGFSPAVVSAGEAMYSTSNDSDMGAFSVNLTNTMALMPAGSNVPVSILTPYLGMNYIICIYGIFPSRN